MKCNISVRFDTINASLSIIKEESDLPPGLDYPTAAPTTTPVFLINFSTRKKDSNSLVSLSK